MKKRRLHNFIATILLLFLLARPPASSHSAVDTAAPARILEARTSAVCRAASAAAVPL